MTFFDNMDLGLNASDFVQLTWTFDGAVDYGIIEDVLWFNIPSLRVRLVDDKFVVSCNNTFQLKKITEEEYLRGLALRLING